MNPQWDQIKHIFQEAMEKSPEERSAFILEACAGDAVLRQEVESLISASERRSDFLRAPVVTLSEYVVLPELQAGDVLAQRFDILKKLGSGGMGVVYQARDRETQTVLAVKVLHPEVAGRKDFISRFKDELVLARKVTHKNVCRVYEFIRADSVVAISMEYINGESLRTVLDRPQGFSIREGLRITRQMVSGLTEAHAQGVIHRDLKPENILIAADGSVKLMDFGIARIADTPRLTDFVKGTPGYMSPEQAHGKPVDARTDIYSLGLVMYEVFCGQRAFSESESILPPEQIDPHVPQFISRIISKCIERSPANRFRSAAELQAALSEVKSDVLTVAEKPHEKSIAVVPFTNLGNDPEQEYFTDGLAEELIAALAGLEGLHVVSRTSAFRFRGQFLDIREIGRQLNVQTVLEGSVRRAGKRLRITVQLINVADGYHLWAQRYDRELEDVFAIQDEITESIVKTLKPTLLAERQSVARRHTDNLQAFELYLKGRYLWQQRSEASLRAGINHFEKAIALDPDYALAHAGIADSYSILRVFGHATKEEARAKAEKAAQRAMELDPELAESHFASALYRIYFTENWPAAEECFRRAIDISPRTAMFQTYFGGFLGARYRFEEADACISRSMELDPVSPFVWGVAALSVWMSRDYERTVRLGEHAVELQQGYPTGLLAIGLASSKLGRHDKAIEVLENLAKVSRGSAWFTGALGMIYGFAGRRREALAVRDELVRRSRETYIVPYSLLEVDLGLGDSDQIYVDLQACLDDLITGMSVEFMVGPFLDPLANEPRFVEMFRRFRLIQPRPGAAQPSAHLTTQL